ncbi:TonB-dependent receptor [Qipengyuania qiaonensis]|uniref:TonB-dependent receptor n=1 Tax=Qipengyuania qiaonensis TaxID=2867240 RepID=A0ABS7J6D4_9SPHN|nr:TonB-dependent receptor [Qipengyuania qiaonensis]MBX7482889.1 TonB-dependent receptor [Qipengyuania qiaonensis]
MKFKYLLAASVVSTASAMVAAPAAAQSTGSIDFDDNVIVVSGARSSDVGGVDIPDTPKAKVQLDSELILRQAPGQTINDTLNLVPGVSFTNNDPFGSLGGNFTIRGFNSDRISQTFDGIPLNDSGNYALYTNQMVDPEIIESATVTLGSTDVDSPTAAAAGGTINIRSKVPDDEFGVQTTLTYGNIISRGDPGDRMMYRFFGKIETGEITPGGLKAFFSASRTENDSTFSNYGGVDKQQYNGKIFQPLGDNGDFVSIAAHYNQNRNNFNGSPVNFSGIETYAIQEPEDRFYELFDGTPCTLATPVFETSADIVDPSNVDDFIAYSDADGYNSCGTPFERRYNPSNTGNVRASSLFTLSDKLTLTVDPSFQWVKANGGGTSIGYEGFSADGYTGGIFTGDIRNRTRIRVTENDDGTSSISPSATQYYYFGGVDLNGDGDTLDYVTILSPSHTQTKRYGVIANLIYDITPDHRVRLAYTLDHARHRQTGTAGSLLLNAEPVDVFPINDPLLDADGVAPQKRNRKSFAILNQVSAEYRGQFGGLTATLGLRVPFFERELNQFCVTTDASGNVNCINGDAAIADYLVENPSFVAPVSATYKYDKLLPNVGLTYEITPSTSIFASYAKNLSVPGTDALYGSLFVGVAPVPETSDSFDLGVRYQTGNIQAQVTGWYNQYNNRLATAYDPILDRSITRNLGKVEKYGVDGSIAWKPADPFLLYVFGSYLKSEIKDDVQIGADSFAATAGKRESGAPKFSFGARAQAELGPVEIGAQIKRTGSRFLNDINTVELPGYTVADLDMRLSLGHFNEDFEKAYFQINVLNVLDEIYIGSAGTGLTTSGGFVNIGPPRAFTASLIWGF